MRNKRFCLMVISLFVFAAGSAFDAHAGDEEKSGNASAGMVKVPGGAVSAGLEIFAPTARTLAISAFSMDKYEVTQTEYEKVMGNNPSKFKGSHLPVERVTWHEANEYCRKAGKRLPTEWEWEHAAKGGSNTVYAWGNEVDSGKANFCDVNCEFNWKNSYFNDGYKNTSPVGSYPPNGYGLYDMAGNVWEWTASDYDNRGKLKVLRGGSWQYDPSDTRPTARGSGDPGFRNAVFGFRCAQ